MPNSPKHDPHRPRPRPHDVQARLDAGDPTFDPLGDLGPLDELPRDRSRSTRYSLGLDGTATGPLFALPAGDATATFRIAAGPHRDRQRGDHPRRIFTESDLEPDQRLGSANLDLPITKRSASIGRLTANANALRSRTLSDFGTLTTLGAGLNWAPAQRLNLTASWTREEGAPSLQQLGDPLIETPNVDIFDFATGETVAVTALTGGNPDLRSDTPQRVQDRRQLAAVREDRPAPARRICPPDDRRPAGQLPAASEALERRFPSGSSAMPRAR